MCGWPFHVLLLSGLCYGLTACPNKKTSGGNDGIRVKGDPAVFIKNSSMAGNIELPDDFFVEGYEYQIRVKEFIEEPTTPSEDFHKIVDEQDPKNNLTYGDGEFEAFKVSINGEHATLTGVGYGNKIKFLFRKGLKGYWLDSLEIESKGKTSEYRASHYVRFIHNSYNRELGAIGIMVHDNTPGERSVSAIYLSRELKFDKNKLGPGFRVLDRAYNYLFGAGTGVSWPKMRTLRLLACNATPTQMWSLTQKSVKIWQDALGDRLDIDLQNSYACPPFGDVNSQTINFIDEWIEISGRSAVFGMTTYTATTGMDYLLDSDINILLGEWQESLEYSPRSTRGLNDYHLVKQVLETTIHEIGHLLGLDHQFTKSIPSVMSYEDLDGTYLRNYDVKAIQELYH